MIVKEFWQVDAFALERYKGNPCAVVFDAEGLSSNQMQTIAAEMNLSETVFVLPPTTTDADYLVRIFTPRSELPFAGHPMIATAFAMLEAGKATPRGSSATLQQECGIGVIPVDVTGINGARIFTMTQGAAAYRGVDIPPSVIAGMLGCDVDDVEPNPIEAVSTGAWWLPVVLRSSDVVAGLTPNLGKIEEICRRIGVVGISPFCLDSKVEGCDVKVRAFAPGEGIAEDPVTGSANGCIGVYIARHHLMGNGDVSYCAEQGTELGRDGKAFVQLQLVTDGTVVVRVGGSAVQVMEGRLFV